LDANNVTDDTDQVTQSKGTTMTKRLSLEVDRELYDRLQKIADQCNRSLAHFILTLLRGYANKYEYVLRAEVKKPAEVSDHQIDEHELKAMINNL